MQSTAFSFCASAMALCLATATGRVEMRSAKSWAALPLWLDISARSSKKEPQVANLIQ